MAVRTVRRQDVVGDLSRDGAGFPVPQHDSAPGRAGQKVRQLDAELDLGPRQPAKMGQRHRLR